MTQILPFSFLITLAIWIISGLAMNLRIQAKERAIDLKSDAAQRWKETAKKAGVTVTMAAMTQVRPPDSQDFEALVKMKSVEIHVWCIGMLVWWVSIVFSILMLARTT